MTVPTFRPRQPLSVSDGIARLVDGVVQTLATDDLHPFMAFGEQTLDSIMSAARDSGSYATVKTLIGRQLNAVEEWREILGNLLKEVGALETRQLRNELYSSKWWDARLADLRRDFAADANNAFADWVRVYTELLLAWELELCSRLVSEGFPFPAGSRDLRTLCRVGAQALMDENWVDALPMLARLAQTQSDGSSTFVLKPAIRAQLQVLIGRIHLTQQSRDLDAALAAFQQASALAPDDGRPDAARGEYYLAGGDLDQALASFQQGIVKSPAEPDGYLGMGQYFEHQSLWDEAEEWYDKAISVVWDEKDVLNALGGLLRPMSGDAWLRVARALRTDEPIRALAAVERALDAGVNGKGGEGSARELQAEILLPLDRRDEAASAYGKAARCYYSQSDFDNAIRLYGAGEELNLDESEPYWYWADSLLRKSYIGRAPYVDEAKIRESLRIWELGFARNVPSVNGIDTSWAYTLRALINEQLARVYERKSRALWWEAAVYLERALVLADQEPYRWAHLSRFHRMLENNNAALQTARAAVDHAAVDGDQEIVTALDEQAAILANTGNFEDALKAIEKRLSIEQSTWLTQINCYVLSHFGNFRKAIELFNTIKEEEDLWSRSLRANCYLGLGSRDAAREDYTWIWARRDKAEYAHSPDDQSIFADAGYYLALLNNEPELLEKAIDICADLRAVPGQRINGRLGICYLARSSSSNVAEAERLLEEHIQQASLPDIADLLNLDLPSLSEWTTRSECPAAVGAAVERIRDKATIRKDELERSRATSPEAEAERAEEELRQALSNQVAPLASDDWATIGALSGLARVCARTGRWSDAIAFYQRLQLVERGRFPEVSRALGRCFEELQASADQLVKEGKFAEARRQLAETLGLVAHTTPNDYERSASLRTRLAYADFAAGNRPESHANFDAALREYRAAGQQAPGAMLGRACRSLLSGVEAYWALDADWRASREEEPGDERRSELAAACEELRSFLDESFQLADPSSDNLQSFVLPIALEIGQELIPADTSPDGALIKTYIPEMKGRVAKDMGVSLPGVRVRPGPDKPDSYRILLYEIPVDSGAVQARMRYCAASPGTLRELGIPESGLVPTNHPVTGAAGAWVQGDHWKVIEEHGIELWAEPLEFAVRHLESALRRNLADFVGIQEAEDLIESWKETERSLVQIALPDQASRWRFARLLRTLVKDSIPLTPWEDVLEAAHAADISVAPLNEVMRAVRMRLRERLPGNDPSSNRIELLSRSEEEQLLRRGDGKSSFVVPPEKALELLVMLRGRSDSTDRRAVLVTHPELRVPFRRMVEMEFPHLMVIARDELIEPAVLAGASGRD
jgi:flagellar biosynthesis protein FlhA